MNLNKKLILIIATISLLSFVFYRIYIEDTSFYNVKTINLSKKEDLIGNKQLINEEIDLFFNDKQVPSINENEAFLLSQGSIENYKGVLNCQDYELVIVKPTYTKEDLMKNNIPIELIAYNDHFYKIFDLYLTNLPVISLEPLAWEYDYFDDGTLYEIVTGSIQVFDPTGNCSENTPLVFEGYAKYRIRGATTRDLIKKSYKLELVDENYEPLVEEILGMRSDDDWNLNAMYLDDSRMREKISYNLWNELNQSTKHNSEYVELVINDDYLGLYLLQEPVDYKKFNSKKDSSILYSIKTFDLDNDFEIESFELNEEENMVGDFEIKVNEKTNTNEALRLLKAVLNDLSGYENDIIINYDFKTFLDYHIFINMIAATDNSYKNQNFIINNKNGQYFFDKTVWDLDISILNSFHNDHHVGEIIDDFIVPKSIKDSDEYNDGLKLLYEKYRKLFYNTNDIHEMLDREYEEIEKGGATIRENRLWENSNYESCKKLVYEFFVERIEVLDDYYDYKD